MPKMGRTLVLGEGNLWPSNNPVTRNAPFGNNDTELKRMRIVGGKVIYVTEASGPETAIASPLAQLDSDSSPARSYRTADKDVHRSDVHAVSGRTGPLNPHRVIPPIGGAPPPRPPPRTPGGSGRQEELALRRRVAARLGAFERTSLREMYLRLAGDDSELTGFVSSDTLRSVLAEAKVDISSEDMQDIFSLYLMSPGPEMVNYEKVLSFIAGCADNTVDNTTTVAVAAAATTAASAAATTASTAAEKTRGGEAPLGSDLDISQLDFGYIRSCFQQAKRQNKDGLSKEQIKTLSDTCGINFTDADFDRILSHFKESEPKTDRYSWESYLDYLQMWQKHKLKTDRVKEMVREEELKEQASLPLMRHPREDQLEELSRRQAEREFADSCAHTDRQTVLATQLKIENEASMQHDSPWFERFMKLANALYSNDARNTGYLEKEETLWLVSEYNNAYNLKLSADTVRQAIAASCLHDDQVVIDALLRTLGMSGP